MNTHYFNNYGFLSVDLPNDLMAKVREEISCIKNDFSHAISYNDRLAGNILHQYEAMQLKPLLEEILLNLVHQYEQQFNYLPNVRVAKENIPLEVGDVWVNFQKKGEYNPIHSHSGVYSFALWVTIPYRRADELAYAPKTPELTNKNGCFTFNYTTSLGNLQEYVVELDTSFENKLVFFPATMRHAVYPFFTSDEYRVSVAGNILFKPSAVKEENK